MKRFRLVSVVLPILAVGAFGSWAWFFATAAPSYSTAAHAGSPTFVPKIKQRAATPAERKAAIASIRAQLDAFKRNDFKRATNFQSQGLRGNFGSPEKFAAMMKSTYPQFVRFKTAKFGTALVQGEGKTATIVVP